MLEPMSAALHSRAGGFTLVEFIVVIAVLALIATLAAPSFMRMLAKKRVEGVTSELVTDLQYARSEALHRNAKVRVTFGPGCYVIHTVGGGGGTTCSASGSSSVDPSEIELKTVQLAGVSTVSLSPNAGLVFLEFDAQRGSVEPTGSIDVISTSGEWQLRAVVNAIGRVRTCSLAAPVAGYSNCS
jgi:type IV fimbrial biogenesis protein FimT